MKLKELVQLEGKFGLITFGKTSELKQLHGKIKCIDDEKDEITFKSTMRKVFHLRARDIKSFEEKEPLPEITEVRGRKVLWAGGILVYEDNGKEYDSKR
jgi:hypothetical protein